MSDCETYIENFISTGWDDFVGDPNLRRLVRAGSESVRSGVSAMGTDKEFHHYWIKTEFNGEGRMETSEGQMENTRSNGRRFRVAVIGDGMVDIYWIGEANSLSAEVPIPVVKCKDTIDFPGGAGNVAANLRELGCEVVEYFGPKKPFKHRLMVGDHQVARWDYNDSCGPIKLKAQDVRGLDAIVVADYGKGSITPEVTETIRFFADCPVFVDTKRDPSVWSGVATAVFPNQKEYIEYFKEYALFKGLRVIKKGEDGINIPGVAHSPSQARFIRSVNGAGDTVIAAFVYKYLQLQKECQFYEVPFDHEPHFQQCLDFANAAAAIAVENPYTYAPTLDEVNERYYEL